MPRRIRHAVHPSHLLTQSAESIHIYTIGSSILACAVCDQRRKYGLIYTCSRSSSEEGCALFWIHLVCAGGADAADEPAAETLHHPSHPRHELRLQRRRKDSCSFHCDACGTVEKGNFYCCSICNYWIHQSCADLPETKDFPSLHHPNHPLSLSFYLPYEYAIYKYACAVCDDDDDDPRLASVITCDGCILPIHQKSGAGGYMYCGECDYFLHLACFNLPPELSSHPLHPEKDHKLTLLQKSNSKLVTNWTTCGVCNHSTNGLSYVCKKCDFKLDIKCASLPDTMKHAGHPRPRHFLKLVAGSDHEPGSCGGCSNYIFRDKIYYRCDSCRFSLCLECAFLPESNKHRLEKHRMPLTYDASVNHPGDFYCGSCERRMHPRTWMYHCRHCEESFHPRCFRGGYQNINFGSRQHYYVDVTTSYHQPHHPLKLQIITTKNRCDLCRQPYMFEEPGYQCADCNFVSCMDEHPNVSITSSSSSSTHNMNSQFLLL